MDSLGLDQTEFGRERTPDGRRFVVSRRVDSDPERAWDLLTDTERWPEWGPSVRAVECTRRFVREGTTGRVRVPGGLWIPFEVTSCREYRWSWAVSRIPATGHFVDDSGAGCRVGFDLPVLAGGYLPVCVRALDHIETALTGSQVGEK